MRNEHKHLLLAAVFIGIFSILSYIVVNTKVEIGPLKDKGIALLNLGKSNESIAYFDKALTINPNDVNTLTQKGLALGRLREYNESISYFDKALAINRNLITAAKEKEGPLAGAADNMEPNIAKKR